jgi:hypothetical protein
VTDVVHTSSRWRRLVAFALFALCIFTALAVASSSKAAIESPPPPQVWSDKADYAPGEQVTLSGANWASGEAVHIRVNDDAGQTWSRDVDVTAGDDGTFSDQFNLPNSFVAVYSVTATGASSGTATWSFTDGNVTLHPAPAADGVTTYRVTYDLWNNNSTTCGGTSHTSPNPTSSNLTLDVTSNTNIPGFGGSTSSALLKSVTVLNPATGKAFDKWTSGDKNTDDGTVLASPVCVTNDNGGGGSGNLTDLYAHFKNSNVAPVIARDNASRTVNEGQTASNTGTWSDTNAGDTVTLSASVGTVTKSGTNASGTWSWSFATNDGPAQTQTVTITANDGNGGVTSTTFSLVVNNVAPTATFNAPASVNEGSNINISLTSPSDPSSVDTTAGFTYAFDCGSGYGAFSATSTASCSTNDNGSRSVKGKIKDKDGGETEYTASVTVNNVAPTGTLGNNGPKDEGSAVSVSFTGVSDPSSVDAASLHYAFDCAGASLTAVTYAGAGTSSSTSCTFNDNGSLTVSGVIIDKDGGRFATTTTVTVTNVAPTADFTNNGPVNEGLSFTLSMDNGDDVSSVDKAAKFAFAFDCGDGSGYGAFTTTPTLSASTSCSTNENGTRSVKAKIKDKDGGVSEYTASVTVNNVAPTVTLSGPATADEGDTNSYSYSWTDPSSADTFPALGNSVDCGSNGTASNVVFTPLSKTGSFDCTWSDDSGSGTADVKATVADDDGGADTDTINVTVANVAPSATFNAPSAVDEGSDISISLTSVVDPGTADTFEYRFKCGDGLWSAYGASSSHACPTDDNGVVTVKGQVRDDDGGESAVYSADVSVNNVAPSVTLTGDATANEGDTNSYSYSWTDPGTADTFPALGNSVSCGVHGTASDVVFNGSAKTGSFKCTWSDDSGAGTAAVKATVADDDGGTDTDTINVTVANVAPKVNLVGPDTANEGQTKTYTYTITDAGSDDTFSFASSSYPTCGDYGQLVGTPAIGDGSFDCTFPDGPNTTNVAIKVKDDDGGVSTADTEHVEIIAVAIANVAPSVTAASNQSSNEGELKSFSLGSFSDPGTDSPWAVDVDWGDSSTHATFDETSTGAASGQTIAAKSHTYDDNGVYTVTVQVTDKNGASDSKTFTVTVANVAPTATFSNTGPVNEGSSFTLSLTDPHDPSGADTTVGFTYAFDCGDGSGYSAYGSSNSRSCPTTDNGTRAVKGKIKDRDGGYTAYSDSVTVNNVMPTVTAADSQNSDEGENHSFSLGSFSDPGSDSPWAVDVDWGDTSTHTTFNETFTGPAMSHAITAKSHKYDDNGSYTVTVNVTDKDGGYDSKSFQVTVANVAPTADFPATRTVNEGSSSTFSFTNKFDPSGADTTAGFHYAYSCAGAALGSTPYASTGTADSVTCPASSFDDGPGTQTVRARIIDKNDGYTEYTTAVTIQNVAPSATFNSPGSVNEGSSFTLSLMSPSDPSTADSGAGFTYAFDCGSGYGAFGASNSTSCPTNDNGSRSVGGKIKDKDGGVREYTGSVTVNNVAPTATFSNDGPVAEGSSFTLQLTSPNDPSSADTTAGFQYAFDCGDGAGYSAYGSSNTRSCPTTDNGTRAVKGKIKDKDGGYTAYSANVTVNNAKPTITNVTATNTYSGPLVFMTSMIKTFFTDPGADAPWSAALNFSDGGVDAGSGNSSPITINHTFLTPGCKTVTARVTDKDGATSDPFGPTSINVGTGEFLPPVTNTPVTNKLKGGQVLPVKVKLTDCNGAPVTGLNPAIALKKGDLTAISDDTSQNITPGSVSNADTTGFMRSNGDGSYIYNMSISGMTLNTDYTIIIYPFGTGSPSQYLAHVIQATK